MSVFRGANGDATIVAQQSDPIATTNSALTTLPWTRRFPVGAELQPDGSVHFRVWAPGNQSLSVELFKSPWEGAQSFPLLREDSGHFSGSVPVARAGDRYKFRLESGTFPDPASRFQPEGPHGPSAIVDPTVFKWTDATWRGLPTKDLVIYELHLGTFTREGTWRAAAEQLPELRKLGITLIEVMPIAEFPGEYGWGYDGVDLFAPCHLYGSPDDAKAFINRAHELGLMVILDVVYNHLGPDGNFLRPFSDDYFTAEHPCEWGEAINFDAHNSAGVREFFCTNARYWIEEFHFDGLRLDATQQIYDDSPVHILTEISKAARAAGAGRQIYIVGENETQIAKLVRPYEKGGYGLDALWNDDFHHSAIVAATGRIEAYYSDYRGTPQEFVSALKRGFLYQGQWYQWQKCRRGHAALDLNPRNFVIFLQNHDQVANSLRGLRLHQVTSPGTFKALTAMMLLAPSTPMLFQGQEFAATSPFLYFADHNPELRKLVHEGRTKFLWQFRTIAAEESREFLAEPGQRDVFERCKLNFAEREKHSAIYRLHGDLLKLRRDDPTLSDPAGIDGAVLGPHAFVLRYFGTDGDDRLLFVNLGADLLLNPGPEPLLAPIEDHGWKLLWSSESPHYGGCGTPPLETTQSWIVPGFAAVVLQPNDDTRLPSTRLSEKD